MLRTVGSRGSCRPQACTPSRKGGCHAAVVRSGIQQQQAQHAVVAVFPAGRRLAAVVLASPWPLSHMHVGCPGRVAGVCRWGGTRASGLRACACRMGARLLRFACSHGLWRTARLLMSHLRAASGSHGDAMEVVHAPPGLLMCALDSGSALMVAHAAAWAAGLLPAAARSEPPAAAGAHATPDNPSIGGALQDSSSRAGSGSGAVGLHTHTHTHVPPAGPRPGVRVAIAQALGVARSGPEAEAAFWAYVQHRHAALSALG